MQPQLLRFLYGKHRSLGYYRIIVNHSDKAICYIYIHLIMTYIKILKTVAIYFPPYTVYCLCPFSILSVKNE